MPNKYTGPLPIAQRLWRKVNKTDTCWIWTGAHNQKGYGVIRIGDLNMLTHRVSYELAHGSIPDGQWVLHHCDNPPCCNPDHLFIGDVRDNTHDAMQKGRMVPPPILIGANNPRTVLDAEKVRAIRYEAAKGMTQRALAAKYHVPQSAIWSVVHRHTWAHIE